MTAYYNEIDAYTAQWLRNLIAADLIAPGEVDERSIENVNPADLVGFTQAHFFAGIGIWSAALRQAGWPDDKSVWTGSAPCQGVSIAGKGAGFADERHLWPHWFHLIQECGPPIVFGEQVASPLGRAWLDLVSSDMEGVGFAFGASDLCSAGVGAPNIRQRIFFVADGDRERLHGEQVLHQPGGKDSQASRGRGAGGLAYSESEFSQGRKPKQGRGREEPPGGPGISSELDHASQAGLSAREQETRLGEGWRKEGGAAEQPSRPPVRVADRESVGRGRGPGNQEGGVSHREAPEREESIDGTDGGGEILIHGHDNPGPVNGFWADSDWLLCTDGKFRPVMPGTFPLSPGHPTRVGQLRAYGNAINPEIAAEFIGAYMDVAP